jgi:hypothetical protein
MHGLGTIVRMNNAIYIPGNGVPTLEELRASHRTQLDRISVTHAKEIAELPERQRLENVRRELVRIEEEQRAQRQAERLAREQEDEKRLILARSQGKTVWVVMFQPDDNDGYGGTVLAVYTREPTELEKGDNDVEEWELTD